MVTPKLFAPGNHEPWNRRLFGQHIEARVARYLKRQGLALIEQNYTCRSGEIDLVMRDEQASLVFVEVRYRRNNHYGSALDSVTAKKQRRIKLAAAHFLVSRRQFGNLACRFDVVAVNRARHGHNLQLQWVKNAFQ